MTVVHYVIIFNDGEISHERAKYETQAEAEEIANSISKGVFDTEERYYEFVELEQD